MNKKIEKEVYVIAQIKSLYAGHVSQSPISFVNERAGGDDFVSVPAQATGYYLSEARHKVAELEEKIYVCGHNEAGRPEYLVVKDGDAEAVFERAVNNQYNWDSCDCKDGERGEACGQCQKCFEYTIDADIESLREVAVDQE
jgi:hypothetical protein